MRRGRNAPLVLLAGLLAVLALGAPAAGARSRALWATVNVCDTHAHPNAIGVRGSMPGGPGKRMFMRFRVQYFRAADHMWHNISTGADSGFIAVGPSSARARQAGQLFVLAPPARSSFELRGKVFFEWRNGTRVVRKTSQLTTAGHHSREGADPAGYSSDTCVIS